MVNQVDISDSGSAQTIWAEIREPLNRMMSVGPALLNGLRLWAAVSLALYVAFCLELDNAYWAGIVAAIIFQPSLGASLRKAWFYVIGTAAGAVAIVALTAFFPQDRFGFLAGLALWCAACGFMSTLLRNFAAFAAALAGFTAAIIAGGELGATGGASEVVFMLALSRASEVCIGIVSAAMVLSWTDFGAAGRRLAVELAGISVEIGGGLAGATSRSELGVRRAHSVQRDLVGRVIALDHLIDEAIGESSSLRLHSSLLKGAIGGLFAALSSWRLVAVQLEQLPIYRRRREVDVIQGDIPEELKSGNATTWTASPMRMRQSLLAAARALTASKYRTPPLRSLADQMAAGLIGLRCAAEGLVLLSDPSQAAYRPRTARFYMPDWLPCLVNSVRIFVTIGAVEIFWVVTAWPTGAQAVTFAAIYVFLLTLQGDRAHSTATDFLIGVCVTIAVAGIVKFAVLPQLDTFGGLSVAIGLVLVPAGTAIALPWRPAIFTFMTLFIEPLVAPENQMTYDTQQFYNLALAIIVGLGSAALAFRLLPPLSPALRTRRLLALASRDLRDLARRPAAWTETDWKRRICSRISALPAQADPSESAQLLSALSLGIEIVRLRRVACRFHLEGEVDAALHALAQGDGSVATELLSRVDGKFASVADVAAGAWARLRSRGSILAISAALAQQGDRFLRGVGQ